MTNSTSPQTKLKIIEQLIILDDDMVFSEIEKLISNALRRPNHVKLTKQQLLERAKQSDDDIKSKRVYSQSEVEKLTKNW